MILLFYLFKTIIISGLLSGYYLLFLRNKQFHQYNRFYLLSIPLIALMLPLFNIPFPGLSQPNSNAGLKILKVITINDWEPEVVITAHRNWMSYFLNWQNVVCAVYIIVAFVLFYLLMKSIFYIIRISRKYNYEKIEDIKLFQTTEHGTPFSFLKNIFWNSEIAMNSEKGNQVFRHELYHVKNKHTIDILLIEFITIVCWFNPFFYLIKKEVKVIHEFLADQFAASSTNKFDYAELLVLQSAANKQISITNYFFHNEIKRRIMMITTFKNTRYGYISRVMALPLLFIIFCAFGVKVINKKTINHFHSNKIITIAIDAGHGGIDNGVNSSSGFLEKNITLSIAKKIEQLGKDYNVNVVMTRDHDILPGNAATIKQGLINRIDIAEKNNAAMFISIHMDATINNKPESGFSIYLSNKNPYYNKSIQLGSLLTEEIKKTYPIATELKERQKGILVLQSSTMPALMIECGYITNKNDLNFIMDENNQEKIAKDILEGAVKFSNNAGYISNIITDSLPEKLLAKDIEKIEFATNAVLVYKNNNTVLKIERDTMFEEMKTIVVNGDEIKNIEYDKESFFCTKKDGSIVISILSKKEKPVTKNKYERTFTKVEIEADYPGGYAAWVKYLNKNLKYPQEAINKEIKGTVLAQFIVNIDGSLNDVKIIQSPSKILSDETLRIIKNSGNWVPAVQNGRQVRSFKKQPVIFKLAA